MKLKKYFTNSNDLSNFLNYAYKKGIKQFHVSNEYSSYNMLIKSFKTINHKSYLETKDVPLELNEEAPEAPVATEEENKSE